MVDMIHKTLCNNTVLSFPLMFLNIPWQSGKEFNWHFMGTTHRKCISSTNFWMLKRQTLQIPPGIFDVYNIRLCLLLGERFNPFLSSVPILYPLVFSVGIKWEYWPEMS